jgi:hypothetical protein
MPQSPPTAQQTTSGRGENGRENEFNRNYEDGSSADFVELEVFALRLIGLPSNSCISVIAYTPSSSHAPHRLGKDRVCDSLSSSSDDLMFSYSLAAFPVTGMVAPQ